MTDTTTATPLPTDWQGLKSYLPAEPPGTSVERHRHAIARLDSAIAAVAGDVERLDTHDRDQAAAIAEAASTDDPIDPVVARITSGDRVLLEHRLDVLRRARSVAVHQLTRAQLTDEAYLHWQDRIRIITAEWYQAQSGLPEQRLGNLIRFADSHPRQAD